MGWFLPVVIGWTGLNAIVLGMILPLELSASKGFIMLVLAEFFAFFGVIFLASRLWGEPPDDTSAHSSWKRYVCFPPKDDIHARCDVFP